MLAAYRRAQLQSMGATPKSSLAADKKIPNKFQGRFISARVKELFENCPGANLVAFGDGSAFSRGYQLLFILILVEEVVVSRVPLELSLAHSAGGRWRRATFGVEALDEADFVQEPAACRPLLVSDGLQ